jgi:hypothetical protein
VSDTRTYYDTSYPPSVWGGGVDPHITSIVPNTVSAAAAATTITVNGSNFAADARVEINQVAQTTTRVSGSQLTISYDPTVAATVAFSVRNVADAEESNSVPFVVGALSADDVSGWTVDEVKDFIREHPDLLAEVTAFERDGQARVTLLDWLQKLLDEEDDS